MNYLNKALDLFNTAIVSPIYYVMFTTFTITASVILFQVSLLPADKHDKILSTCCKACLPILQCCCLFAQLIPADLLIAELLCCIQVQEEQSARQATTEICGFVTIVIGTFLLHSTKDLDITLASLNAATKSTLERGSSFNATSLSDLQMQRLPLTSNGALNPPTPIGHRMTNSDRF